MTDYFALLDEPRRPWVDTAALKEKFVELSAKVHPDRFHTLSPEEKQRANESYTELNAAQQCLSSTRERLKHLLELELGALPQVIEQVPEETMETFMEMAQLTRGVDAFLEEKAKATSPLLKVQFFQKGMEWTDKINLVQDTIRTKLDHLEERLKDLNSAWADVPTASEDNRSASLPLMDLEKLFRVASHLTRWSDQLKERVARLAF